MIQILLTDWIENFSLPDQHVCLLIIVMYAQYPIWRFYD